MTFLMSASKGSIIDQLHEVLKIILCCSVANLIRLRAFLICIFLAFLPVSFLFLVLITDKRLHFFPFVALMEMFHFSGSQY